MPPGSDLAFRLEKLKRSAGAALSLRWDARTGRARFFSKGTGELAAGLSENRLMPVERGEWAKRAARAFLREYGPLFGVESEEQDLQLVRIRHASGGRSFVRFRRVENGIPILGAELIVQVGASGGTLSAHGKGSAARFAHPAARLDAATARAVAIDDVAKHLGADRSTLKATEPQLWIFDPALLGAAIGPSALVWRVVVSGGSPAAHREMILVDTASGGVRLRQNLIASAFATQVWDNINQPYCGLPGCLLARETGEPPVGQADIDAAYSLAAGTYDFYASRFGRDGIDDAAMPIIATVRFCPDYLNCPYANAFWNGEQLVAGAQFARADDVIAHELTHGVTDHESNLFYGWQSGAINESLSDIFGELYDLTNGVGNDALSARWLIGEDLPTGPLRDMADPPARGHPDSMSSPLYACGMSDQGGIHSNSGVGNKVASLLVDGGALHGRAVSPIGITKTALIFYDVATNWLTSGADYLELYDALFASCASLVGTEGITAADCGQVDLALLAVEAHRPEPCEGRANLPPCDDDSVSSDRYATDFEESCPGWSGLSAQAGAWWQCGAPPPYGPFTTSGISSLFGAVAPLGGSYSVTMAEPVVLTGGGSYLRFRHAHGFEANAQGHGYDGGIVEYSTDGGASWSDAGPLFVENGYNGVIDATSGNPLGGRPAFTGWSRGYYTSRLALEPLGAGPALLRFTIGSDSGTTDLGWYIDDLSFYTCGGLQPAPSISSISPAGVPAGDPGIRLVVNGSGFVPGSAIEWNAQARSTTYISGGQLESIIPPGDIAVEGSAQVRVSNPTPGGGSSNVLDLSIGAPCPGPALGAGTTQGGLNDGDCALDPLGPGRRHDRFMLSIEPGRGASLKAESSSLSPSLLLRLPDGTELRSSRCGRKKAGACLRVPADAASRIGLLTLSSAEPSGRGSYVLHNAPK